MKFAWDDEKRRSNVGKHGIDFADAVAVFEGPLWERPDAREAYGEERWVAVGRMRGRVIVVVYAERKNVVRIISARKATRHEAEQYFRNVGW